MDKRVKVDFNINNKYLKALDNNVKKLKKLALEEGLEDQVKINDSLVLEEIIKRYFLKKKAIDENKKTFKKGKLENIFGEPEYYEDIFAKPIYEKITIKITKKEKEKIMDDNFYIESEKPIESYIKKSKSSLEFLEESILKNLRNYFSRNEVEELHQLVDKDRRFIMNTIFDCDNDFTLNHNIFHRLYNYNYRTWGNREEKEIDQKMLVRIAMKVYQLEEHEVFTLMHFLLKNSYELEKARDDVQYKLTGIRFGLEPFLIKKD